MPITGNLLIDNQWQPGESGSRFAVNPANGETLPTTFTKATARQVTLATRAAGAAFDGRPLTLSLSRWESGDPTAWFRSSLCGGSRVEGRPLPGA